MNPDRQCTATSAQSGERCRKAAILGHHVCAYHGGSSPQVRAAAKRRLAEDRARRRLDEVEVEEVTDPISAYRRIVSEAVGVKNVLAAQVAALEDMRANGSTSSAEAMRAEFSAYERALDRAQKALATWISLGLEERFLEQQAAMTADQLRLIVSLAVAVFEDPDLGLRPDQQAKALRLLQEYVGVAVDDGLTTGVVDGARLLDAARPGWQPGEVSFLELTPAQRQDRRHRTYPPFGTNARVDELMAMPPARVEANGTERQEDQP